MSYLGQIEPHTKAKHRILKNYLDAWFPILGQRHRVLHYLDGFAGPGRYETGEDGSPLIAIKSATAAIERGALAADRSVHFTFIESNKGRSETLAAQVANIPIPSTFKIQIVRGQFKDKAYEVIAGIERLQGGTPPTFAFVDPFGFSGIPMSLMHQIMQLPRCEVLVNFMVSFVNRFVEHPDPHVVAEALEATGSEDIRNVAQSGQDRREALLEIYRRELRRKARHVCRFDMQNRQDSTLFSLFFGSNGPKGFEK